MVIYLLIFYDFFFFLKFNIIAWVILQIFDLILLIFLDNVILFFKIKY